MGLFSAARVRVRTSHPDTVRALVAAPPVSNVDGLNLSLMRHDPDIVRGLVLPDVRRLELLFCEPSEFAALADRPRPPGLERLQLVGVLTADNAERLASAGWVGGLRGLNLGAGYRAGESELAPLLRARDLGGLRSLDLSVKDVAATADDVAAADGLGPLDSFDLRIQSFGVGVAHAAAPAAAVRSLVLAPALVRVRKLALPRLADPDSGLSLAGALPGLRVLDFEAVGATRAGFAALARSPATGTLRRVRFTHADLTFAAASGLTDGPGWLELAALSFSSIPWHQEGYTAEHRHTPASDGGAVAALINSPKFPRLTSLDAGGTNGAADLWRRLAASDAVARFRRLRLAFPIGDAELNALLDSPAVRAVGHLGLPVRRGITAKTRRRFEQIYGVPLTRDA